jgi:hypothetical protein
VNFRGHVLLLEAIEQFHTNGEMPKSTHLQKAMFFLLANGVEEVPFSFILYKHGPFSVDIESELGEMKSYCAICSDSRPGFSQVLVPGTYAPALKQKVQLGNEERAAVAEVCRFLARKPLVEIELLATAAWIKANEQLGSLDEIANRLQVLKPYVSHPEAVRRVGELEHIIPQRRDVRVA